MNPKAFEKMVGFTSAGSPLIDVLKKHSGLKKADITSTLRHASLIGENPTRTAQKMVKAGYDDMGHALLVARRSTMRVAQEVGNENFKKNGVEYVQWVSGETAYTCAACWAMSGRIFEVGKAPHDHPNGRCVFNPYLPELAELDPDLYKHDPEENFAKLSEEEQKEILGPAKFEAWKSGEFKLTDFVAETNSKDYGESIKIPSLKDLGLDKTPAERYNIDESLADKFNKGVPPEMRKLFAPYLQSGKVDPDFNDSGVSKVVKDAKGYVHPLDLAVKMQEYSKEKLGNISAATLRDKIEIDGYVTLSEAPKSAPPIYKTTRDLLRGSEEAIAKRVAFDWEDHSHSKESVELREAVSLLWGGDVYDPKNRKINPANVIYKMYISKYIYDDTQEKLNTEPLKSLFLGGKFTAHRAVEKPHINYTNSLESWAWDAEFPTYWGEAKVEEKRWKDWEPLDKSFKVGDVFVFGAFAPNVSGNLLERNHQKELVILGGLADNDN